MEGAFNTQEYLSAYTGLPLVLRAKALSNQKKVSPSDAAVLMTKGARDAELHESYASVFKEANTAGHKVGAYDQDWYDKKSREFKARLQKLEDELGKYKASLIKTSIQASYMELAKANISAGRLEEAVSNVLKAKETINTPMASQEHTYTYKLVNLLAGKYAEVTGLAHQAEDIQNLQTEDREAYGGSRAITAIAQLAQMNYSAAIEGFLSLTSGLLGRVQQFSALRDIALYIGILSILHLNRREVLNKVLAGETKQILGENPAALLLVEGFVNADYEQQVEVDSYISHNTKIIREAILDKAIKQYISVCNKVKISTIASVFRLDPTATEKRVLDYIQNRQIPYLIDPFEKTLNFRKAQGNDIEDIVKQALRGIEKYIFDRQIAKLKFDISSISYKKHADSQMGGGYDMY